MYTDEGNLPIIGVWGSHSGFYMCAESCATLCDPMDCSLPGSPIQENFQAKTTGAGCHFLLQGIFLTQGSNLCLLYWPAEFFTTGPPGLT